MADLLVKDGGVVGRPALREVDRRCRVGPRKDAVAQTENRDPIPSRRTRKHALRPTTRVAESCSFHSNLRTVQRGNVELVLLPGASPRRQALPTHSNKLARAPRRHCRPVARPGWPGCPPRPRTSRLPLPSPCRRARAPSCPAVPNASRPRPGLIRSLLSSRPKQRLRPALVLFVCPPPQLEYSRGG